MARASYDEVKLFVEGLGYVLISETYTGTHNKLILKDFEGYYYSISYHSLKDNKSYPSKFHNSNPYTVQNIKLWLKLNNKSFNLISDTYRNSNEKLQWKCLKENCEEEFEMNWDSIRGDSGCSYCAGKKVSISNCLATINPKLAKEWSSTKNGDLTPYDVTCYTNKKVWWKCNKNNNHEWNANISDRSSKKSGCPYCAGTKICLSNCLATINPDLALEWHPALNGNLTPFDVTANNHQEVWWKCRNKECNCEWPATIANRNYNDSHCPECSRKSVGEIAVSNILNLYDIPNTSQFRIEECRNKRTLPFDHAIFRDKEKTQLTLLIEFDGKRHFEPVNFGGISEDLALEVFSQTQIHDEIKTQYCLDNNIPLLRIHYKDLENVSTILTTELHNQIHNNI